MTCIIVKFIIIIIIHSFIQPLRKPARNPTSAKFIAISGEITLTLNGEDKNKTKMVSFVKRGNGYGNSMFLAHTNS